MAGYAGYLIKVLKKTEQGTDYTFPMEYIVEKSYKPVYSVMDSEAKRNAVGDLIRKTLPKKRAHCAITIRSLNNTQFAGIFTNLSSRYIINKERKIKLSMFIPEINDYVEDYFYIPDPQPTISHIDGSVIHYEPYELEFIGY